MAKRFPFRPDPTRQAVTREPRKMGDVIADLLQRKGYAHTRSAADLERAWQETAGGVLGAHSQAGNLRRGVLEIHVRNSTVLQELSFRKRELLDKLQQSLNEHGITDLKFRIGVLNENQKG